MKFRNLRADEIDARVKVFKEGSYVQLLLYKDARCDMNILDETVGCMNWKREHSRDNANCTVSIWDEAKNTWVSKEDTGTKNDSNEEKSTAEKNLAEKSIASDSFKRACVNWGIGRELYTSPEIRFFLKDFPEINKYTKYKVYHINTVGGKITELGIKAVLDFGKTEKIVFRWKSKEGIKEYSTEERIRKIG